MADKDDSNKVEELEGSELGTKDYWDGRYDMEIRNYKSHKDVGEIWFDESSQDRIVRAITRKLQIGTEERIIDIGEDVDILKRPVILTLSITGTGNGMMLIELAQEGFTKLVGVDYSLKAVQLSESIAKDNGFSDSIQYHVVDMVKEEGNAELEALGLYRVVHDKGTYDAISLNPENAKEKRMAYIRNIVRLLTDDGYFIITSCNWTEDELRITFQDYFEQDYIIPSPQFMFGGKVGSVVSSVVFKKKK